MVRLRESSFSMRWNRMLDFRVHLLLIQAGIQVDQMLRAPSLFGVAFFWGGHNATSCYRLLITHQKNGTTKRGKNKSAATRATLLKCYEASC